MRIARKSEDEPYVVADVIGQYVVCSCNKHRLQFTLGVFNSNVRLKKTKGPTELSVTERSPLNYSGRVLTVHV